MLDSLGTEILSDETLTREVWILLVTFQLYRPAGLRWRGGVGERELHTARVLVAVGVPGLVLHTHSQHTGTGDTGE